MINLSKTKKLKSIDFLFKNYLSFPKAERNCFYLSLLDETFTIKNLEMSYSDIIIGVNYKTFKNNKNNSNKLLITKNTKVNYYYKSYRILIFLDMSRSMFNYDIVSNKVIIEKIEENLKNLFQNFKNFSKKFRNFKPEEYIDFFPDIYLSIFYSINENDFPVINHEIYFEKETYEYYLKKIIKKIKFYISNLINFEVTKIKPNINNQNDNSYLNKILQHSLFLLDLLPREATPILFILTDSNLNLNNIGKYNNILHQFNRKDIKINIINLLNINSNFLMPFNINNQQIMQHICEFTDGKYFNYYEKLNDNNNNLTIYPHNIINLNINENENNSLIIFNKSNNFEYIDEENDLFNKPPKIFYSKQIKNYKKLNVDVNLLNNLNNSKKEYKNIFYCLDSFKILKNIELYHKELFDEYEISLSYDNISIARIREGFKITKNKYKFKLKIFPDTEIIYVIEKKEPNSNNFIVKIFISSKFIKLNQLKLEYIKNSYNIEKDKNNYNPSYFVTIIINFITEIVCNDKILNWYYEKIKEDFNENKQNFIESHKDLWNYLANLNIDNWYRFFNVEIIEVLIKNENYENMIKNKLNSNNKNKKNENELLNTEKNIIEEFIYKFCDKKITEINFGFKLIPKSLNNNEVNNNNGFLVIKFNYIFDNLLLIYFGFFQCLSVTRKTNIKNFCEYLNSNQKFKLFINYYRHLSLIYNNFNNYNENEIFTYQPNQKVMNNFFHKKDNKKKREKKNFKLYEFNNEYFSFLFYKFLILQRLKENFSIMDLKDNKIILIYKFDMINLKNPMKFKFKNWFKNYFYIIYVITLNDNKILIEINIEPFSGFIILKKIADKKEKYKKLEGFNFLSSIISYFKNSENKIYDWIKTYGYLINIIYKKLIEKDLFTICDKKTNFYSLFFEENKYKFDDLNFNHLKNLKVEVILSNKSEKDRFDRFKNNLNLISSKEFTINNFQNIILCETMKRILDSLKECFDNLLKDIIFKINNHIFYGNLFNINTFIFISIPQINIIDNEDDINLNNKFNINFYYLSLDSLKVEMIPLIEMLLKKYSKNINEFEEDENNLSDNESNNPFKDKKKRSERSLSINENDNIDNYYIKNCLKTNILLHPLKEENNKNYDEIINKSDLFNVSFSEFLTDYFDYTSFIIDNIIEYNKIITNIIYFPEEINNLKNFYSFEINFDILKLISYENEYEFFFSKFKMICNDNFFVIKDNLYVNKKIHKNENNYNLIMEINFCFENDFIPFVLDFEKLYNLIKNNKKFILKIKIFFLPFYQNIYTKKNINKIINENNLNSIKKENYEIYYKNDEINDFKKQIPFFFKKKNFYFFINEIEEYLLKLHNNFLSIEYVLEIEKIRNQINSKKLNNQELINEGLIKMNKITNIDMFFNEKKEFEIKYSKYLNKYFQNSFIFNNNFYSINFFESDNFQQKLFKTEEILPFWCLFNYDLVNNSKIRIILKWIKIFEKKDIKSKKYLEYTKNIFKIIEAKIFFINKNLIIDIIREKRNYIIDDNKKETNKVKFKEDLNKYFGRDKYLIVYEGKYNENNILKILNKFFENNTIKNSENYFILEDVNDIQQFFIFSFKINNFHHSNTFHFNSMKKDINKNKNNKIEELKKTFIINKLSLEENKPKYLLNHDEKFLIDFYLYGLTSPNENILNLLQNSFKTVMKIEKLNIYIKLLENKKEIKKLSQYKIFDVNEYKNNNIFEKKKENIKYLDETINYFYELTNKVFDKLVNNKNYNQDFSFLDFEIIRTFSEVYNIENNFKILKNYKFLKKNLVYNLINFYQYFKENKIKFIKYNSGMIKILFTFHEQTNYFFYLTYESLNDDDMNKEYEINYEIIKRKLNEDDNKINIEENINSEELNNFLNEFIEDFMYIYNIEYIYLKYKK